MKILAATLLLLLVFCSIGIGNPKEVNNYSKQIVGRWLGDRKFEIYYADGSWAVQRNEASKPDNEGRHWHIEDNKLTLIFPGGSATETIVSMSKSKFVTKDGGFEDIRTRVK